MGYSRVLETAIRQFEIILSVSNNRKPAIGPKLLQNTSWFVRKILMRLRIFRAKDKNNLRGPLWLFPATWSQKRNYKKLQVKGWCLIKCNLCRIAFQRTSVTVNTTKDSLIILTQFQLIIKFSAKYLLLYRLATILVIKIIFNGNHTPLGGIKSPIISRRDRSSPTAFHIRG